MSKVQYFQSFSPDLTIVLIFYGRWVEQTGSWYDNCFKIDNFLMKACPYLGRLLA